MAQKKKVTTTVYEQTVIAKGIYDMWIDTDMAGKVVPGQFVAIYPQNASTLLPRPISVCETDVKENRIRIVYRVVGEGTKEFSDYHASSKVSILGPLGNGYPLQAVKKDQTAFLIGGGIGIPPMLELSKQLNCKKIIICGYRKELFLNEALAENGTVVIATEDGSTGTKGTVIDAIKENGLKADVIFACGPMPMLRAIKQYAVENGIDAYISLEERMACGVGACLGCVCKTKDEDAHSHVNNARICTDGPVFEAKEVQI